jgi:hypothetical protein
MAFANILANTKLPEPQYKDRYNERVYQEELIATMDWLHEREMEGKI